jgi:hypothetical protein
MSHVLDLRRERARHAEDALGGALGEEVGPGVGERLAELVGREVPDRHADELVDRAREQVPDRGVRSHDASVVVEDEETVSRVLEHRGQEGEVHRD